MSNSRAAIRYAKAALSLSLDLKNANEVNENMISIDTTIEGSDDLKAMLKSPVIRNIDKKKALDAIFGAQLNNKKTSSNLIGQLIENRRIDMLQEVAKQYTSLYEEHQGTQVAHVTSAVELTADVQAKILAKVKELIGKEVSIVNKIDPSIIGGFILRVGDKQFDASVTGKMNNLRRSFEDNIAVSN